MPMAGELQTIREIIKILKPLEYMTKELSGEDYITASSHTNVMCNAHILQYNTGN